LDAKSRASLQKIVRELEEILVDGASLNKSLFVSSDPTDSLHSSVLEARRFAPALRYLQEAAPGVRKWNYDLLKKMLTNELYRGTLSFGTNERTLTNRLSRPTCLRDVQEIVLESTRREEAERNAFQVQAHRPNVEQVAELWRHFHQLWEEATEWERTEIAQSLVEKVALTGKREGIQRRKVDQTLPRTRTNDGKRICCLSLVRNSMGVGSRKPVNYELSSPPTAISLSPFLLVGSTLPA
jgi:predicted unusual protein kinase regulating ubiquinone biosynthesis (AarF/ABC1/UbiB family)